MPFVARTSPWRAALIGLAGLGMAALGAWLGGLFGPPPVEPPVTWFGWLGLALFGPLGILWLRRAMRAEDQVRFDRQGLWVRSHGDTVIPWTQVSAWGVWQSRQQKMLVLQLVNPEAYPAQGLAGKLAAANRRLTGGDVAISLTGTDRSFAEAEQALQAFLA